MNNIHLWGYLWYTDIIQGKGWPSGRISDKGADMELKEGNGEGIDTWEEVTLIYNAALRQIETKIAILNEEFQHVHHIIR